MIKIENLETYGWEAAFRGMRNPKNSWEKSDSYTQIGIDGEPHFVIGPNDFKLASTLLKAGTDHGKFIRMVTVTCDITAPLYWWKEFDTYKVGTVADSCSTMHKIQAKEFVRDDFSHEHLSEGAREVLLWDVIPALESARIKFLETKDKQYWWDMIQLLPTSFNQKRTVQLNYAVLRNMLHSRSNHKLDEWHEFLGHMLAYLPYGELLMGDKE